MPQGDEMTATFAGSLEVPDRDAVKLRPFFHPVDNVGRDVAPPYVLKRPRVVTARDDDQSVGPPPNERADPFPFAIRILLRIRKKDVVVAACGEIFDLAYQGSEKAARDVRHHDPDHRGAP